MATNEDINNINAGLAGMDEVIASKYAERVNPLGQAVANFASGLGFGNSTTFGTAKPSSAMGAANAKITPGTNTPGYGTQTNFSGNMGYSSNQQQQGIDPTQQYESVYQSILDKYGQTTGGPNAGVLRSLNQGIQQKNQQYKQNSASVENMYGELSQESENAKKSLLGAYEQSIGQTGERASGLQNVLSQEGAAQEARRVALAAELGVSPENALTQYSSQQRLNEAMGQVLSQGQSWQGLLESQKLSAKQQADRMRTAIGNTKSATKLGLTEAYQNALNNYKSQIAQEKSKVATTQLSPFGQIQADVTLGKYKEYLNGGGTAKQWEKDQAPKFDEFSSLIGQPVTDGYNSPQFATMLQKAQQEYDKLSSGGVMTPQVLRFMQIFDIKPSDLVAPQSQFTYGG
jgi:hypothetical protein